MKSFELKPLVDNVIPGHIQDLISDDLTNYIIVKDGYILTKELSDQFAKVVIESYEHALPDYINVFNGYRGIKDVYCTDHR